MDLAQSLLARRQQAIARGISTATEVFAARALNAELWDVAGRRYIDFAAGIAVLNTGHRHPKVMAAVAEQMQQFTHTAFQVAAYESCVRLAERLNALAPVVGPAKSLFLTTGVEAVENAVKIARLATSRTAVIAFSGAFHGRTMLGMALTGKTSPYKTGFGPLAADVYHLPFPVVHEGITTADSLRALQLIFRSDAGPERVAAIIVEPVQGEGGFHPAPVELLVALRKICDEHGIVLIVDEIQTGFARTGKLFALEHFGVRADLLVAAKSLAGGFPLSGVIGSARIMDAPAPGGLGGTYAASPIACAAANAVLDVIDSEKLEERADVLGARVRRELQRMAADSRLLPIGNIRGLGSMLAFDVVTVRGGTTPVAGAGSLLAKKAHQHGLILLSCGTQSEAVRLLYPLTIQESVLDEGLALIEAALRESAAR
jgi:4-aminobutyrate aminotransferase/(S)-3-amino-2-methylpropionate transaminase